MKDKKEALFDFIYGENFDSEVYESKEDAIENLVEYSYQSYGLDSFECDGGEYLVADSYSDAEEAAKDSIKDLFDDIGIEGFNLGSIESFVDSRWFEEAEKEMHESYVYDIKDETSSDEDLYVNRLHEELCDNGLMDPLELPTEPERDDFEDESDYDSAIEDWENECESIRNRAESEAEDKMYDLSDNMMSNDSIEYYIDNFGESEFNDVAKRNDLFDIDAIAQYVLDTDGVGHILAGYDGNEYEQNGCYIYRTN
mgnify:CR=1 FL=1